MRLSIVTVCLNDLTGLRTTYESVHIQTRPPDEWIVVDGGSSDGTTDWLEQNRWTPLRWTSGRDGGIYEGMNLGLRRVESGYVLFLNSGDTLASPNELEAVELEIERLQDLPALILCDSLEVDRKHRSYLRRSRPTWWVWLGMPTTHQAMFFRRDALGSGFDVRYRLGADYAAVCSLYCKNGGSDFHHFARAICDFYLGGRTDQFRRESLREMHRVRREVLGMSSAPSMLLHAAHHVQRWVKSDLPFLHRLFRYGKRT